MCYFSLGYSDDALNMFDIVIDNILSNFGIHHALYGVAVLNKATYYANITNYSEAIVCINEALICLKTIFGERSEKYATCLLNLGECYLELDDYSNASAVLNEAVKILEDIGSPYLMAAYSDIIAIHYLNRDFNDVTELLNKVHIGIRGFQLENTDIEADLYGKIGYAMLKKKMPEAQKFLKKYLDIQENCGGKNTLQFLYGLSCYAISSFYNNSQSESIIPILASHYRETYLNNVVFLGENDRESMITGPYYSQIKDILFSSRNEGNNDIDLYDFILFYKSLLLSTSISYSSYIYNSGNKTLIEKYNRLLKLQSNLNESSIFEDAVKYEKIKRESSKIERSLAEFLKQNGSFEDYIRYTFQDIKKSLKSDEMAIEFVNYNDLKDGNKYYIAMLVSNEWDVPLFINIGASEEFEKLMSISPNILYGKSDISRQAYYLVWSKIVPYLNNVKTIYFSPSGVFNKIAIEHLNNGTDCFNYLFNTIRLSSSREICKAKSQSLPNKAILYGGLYYDEDDTIMVKESRLINSTKTVAPELFRGSNNASETKKVWAYLPGSLDEIQKISSILNKSNVEYISYTATKGNEESFKALSGQNVDILHIATHGYYITESQSAEDFFIISNPFIAEKKPFKVQPLLRSGLILSGGNRAWNGDIIPDGIEDGILTSYEISTLDMHNCDVVVLSACETALGDISDDGVIGLQRAFKKSGVKSIIMSLWEVDDNVTALMMQSFYDNLIKGMNRRNAFNAAQDYIRGQFPDPRYWATFIMLD